MKIYNQSFTREYLIMFEYVLYTVLYLLSRNELHKWISQLAGFLLIYYIFIGRNIENWTAVGVITGVLILFSIVLLMSVYYIKMVRKQIDKKNYLPIFIALLFIGSYMSGINAKHFHLPWVTGYVLATISFFIGIIMYRKQLK